MEEKENLGTVLKFFENPKDVMSSPKFGIASATAQFIMLVVFAIVGAGITFRFQSFQDVLNLDYWVTVVIMLGEQLYAYNIGYDLGRTLMISSNKELKKAEEQIEAIVEGVPVTDENDLPTGEWKLEPLKKDTAYIDLACKQLTEEDKIELIKSNTKEIIKMLESKVAEFKSKKHNTWLFYKRVKVNRRFKKRFWKKATAINYCMQQIEYLNNLIEDKESMLAIPDKNVSGYYRIEYSNVISAQPDTPMMRVSKYHQRNENVAKSKMAGRKALKKFAIASIGGAFVFGVIADGTLGTIVYMIAIMLWQVFQGFKFGGNNVISIVLYNTVNRLKALQDIRKVLPDIKEKEKKKVITEEDIFYKKETNTTDILPELRAN